jgi:hypothetical protein
VPNAGQTSASIQIFDNAPPIAVDDTATTDEDTPVIIDVLANDTDPEGSSLTLVGYTFTPHGTLAIVNNQLEFTPEPHFNGNVSIVYQVSDGVTSSFANVLITVNPVNDAPVARDDFVITGVGQSITVDLLLNDTEPDGETMTVTAISVPSGEQAQLNSDGTITFTPNGGFVGTVLIGYTVEDQSGNSSTATLEIQVLPVVTITVADDQTLEDDENDSISFTVHRTGDLSQSLTVSYIVTGTSKPGVDPALLPGTVTFPAGSSTVTLTGYSYSDEVAEDDETIIVAIDGNTDYLSGTTNYNATATIADNDIGIIVRESYGTMVLRKSLAQPTKTITMCGLVTILNGQAQDLIISI